MQDKILLLVVKYNTSLSYNVTDISMQLFWVVKNSSFYQPNFTAFKKLGKMGTQKYMLTKSETSYSNFLAVMQR